MGAVGTQTYREEKNRKKRISQLLILHIPSNVRLNMNINSNEGKK